jgi:hypothetical protein
MKELLRVAAEREHRTLSNMIEVLVLDYCESKGIAAVQDEKPSSRTRKAGSYNTKVNQSTQLPTR